MTRTLFYILIFQTVLSYGQISCDNKTVSDLENQFNKADKRGKSDEYKYAFMTFDIAECYRQKNDTICLKWYRKHIAVCNSVFGKGCIKEARGIHGLLYRMGVSSFCLGQYKVAETYFNKAYAAKEIQTEGIYMLGISLMKQEKYAEANIEFNNYKKSSSDYKDVAELIKTCNEKINGK